MPHGRRRPLSISGLRYQLKTRSIFPGDWRSCRAACESPISLKSLRNVYRTNTVVLPVLRIESPKLSRSFSAPLETSSKLQDDRWPHLPMVCSLRTHNRYEVEHHCSEACLCPGSDPSSRLIDPVWRRQQRTPLNNLLNSGLRLYKRRQR